ncbi:hypothetical protein [Paracoccus tibetensis]|uniref:Uncharacterized protein n=1 Tax=Paracoccus tibetensis TaxID=336292 RepID=A0A1G5IXN9_9RHOB|nr:hypothetical protein [Paracoccus tibetensis]SCY80853.1 hypothetical protein SAMN05660710_02854 [Paracoccus tibetensis]
MNRRDPLTSKRALMARIQTEGIEAAFEALMDVCKDKKAPAPARATAGTSIFRAGGLMSNKPEVLDKPPEEMSAAEIVARINELEAKRNGLLAGIYSDVSDDDQDDDDNDERRGEGEGDDDQTPNDLFG